MSNADYIVEDDNFGGQAQPQQRARQTPKDQPSETVSNNSEAFRQGLFGRVAMSGINTSVDVPLVHQTFQQICNAFNELQHGGVVQVHLFDDPSLLIPAELMVIREGSTAYMYPIMLTPYLKHPIADSQFQMQGKTISLPQTAESLWAGQMAARAADMVARLVLQTPLTDTNVLVVGLLKLPATGAYKTLAECVVPFDHGMTALTSYMSLRKGIPTAKYNIGMIKSGGFVLQVRSEMTPAGVDMNTLGQPVATDVKLSLIAKKSVGQQPRDEIDLHQSTDNTVLTTTNLTVDFIPLDGTEEKTIDARTKVYPLAAPMIVVRQTTSILAGGENQDNLLTQLFGLLMAKMWSEKRWPQMFEPSISNVGMNNIGLLGLLGDPRPGAKDVREPIQVLPYNSSAGADGGMTVSEIVQYYCSESPIIAIDVHRGGPLEPIQATLLNPRAASHICTELSAFVAFYDDKGNLVHNPNAFADFWESHGGPREVPVLDPNKKLQGKVDQFEGSFTSTDHSLHSTGEIDLLVFLNEPNVTDEVLESYCDAQLPLTGSVNEIANRLNLIKGVLPQSTITGKSLRHFINPEWLGMVSAFLAANKVFIDMDEDFNYFGERRRLGLSREFLASSDAKSGVFRPSYSRAGGGIGAGHLFDELAPMPWEKQYR